jgi:hypothetical protein
VEVNDEEEAVENTEIEEKNSNPEENGKEFED